MPGAAPPAPAFVAVVSEVAYYLSLALPLGMALTVGYLAIPEDRGGIVSRQARRLALPVAVCVAAAVALRWTTSAASGIGLVQLAGLMLAAIGLVMMGRSASRWLAVGVAAVTVVVAVLPEIPLRSPTPDSLARNALTTVHLLGALSWVGGLVVLAAVGLSRRRSHADDRTNDAAEARATEWAQIWERFSMAALIAVAAVIVTGVWLAWVHVGTPSQLFTTPYGRYLAIKLVLVVALLAAGGYNTRVVLPKIRALQQDGDTHGVLHLAARHFPAVVCGEAVIAIGVLAVVPFLRGSARSQAGWPSAGPFDLSVFGTGVLLLALVAAAMWAGTRRPVGSPQPSTPVP
ncbi:CopD family protein [Mycolicibacterium sp. CH28]|uniref:CopD family protein n=1 Tax=Mycolicibacterium sp. CH28 TaxID=2512237 RepID=UPI00108141A7|nr:CopD family protein [Mycolicibacterium sp. CH28]TGD89265.1 CopD family protein [Mycolicibacterium sp. CH28]